MDGLANWKDDLKESLAKKAGKKSEDDKAIAQNYDKGKKFIESQVVPAFNEVKDELVKNGKSATVGYGGTSANITVVGDREEFNLTIEVVVSPLTAFPRTQEIAIDRKTGKRWRAEGSLRTGAQDYDVTSITKDEIIQEVVRRYKTRINSPE
jgi:hypothetical protein